MFRKKTDVDKIVDSIKGSSKLSRLEKFSFGFNFLIGIVTLLLSIWAIKLTQKYGENTDQITKLGIIAENQKTEMSKLIAMVEGLNEQNKLTQEQNIELKSQGKIISNQSLDLAKQLIVSEEQNMELKKQGKIIFNQSLDLSKQLAIIQERERKADNVYELETKSHIRELDVASSKLYNIFPPFRKSAKIKYTQEQQIEIINKTKDVIDILATNSLIILNDSLPNKLKNLVGYISLSLDINMGGSPAETKLRHFEFFIEKLVDFQISLNYYRGNLYKRYKML